MAYCEMFTIDLLSRDSVPLFPTQICISTQLHVKRRVSEERRDAWAERGVKSASSAVKSQKVTEKFAQFKQMQYFCTAKRMVQ